ncbi:MAG: hypothetical protein V1739_09195 [Candidatus Omnitrophota bacterium]
MPRKYLIMSVFILLSVIITSYATAASKKQQEEAVYTANFNYAQDSQAAPGSCGVTFAVESVNYQSNSGTIWLTWPQFANLDAAMKQDLTKIFTAKGITLRGPFDSYDLMPYQDKKASDLYAVPTLELTVFWQEGPDPFTVSGKFTLVLKEIMTGEAVWSKTIPLISFRLQKIGSYQQTGKDDRLIKDLLETGNRNDVAKGIEKQYPGLMATISKLIDPEEMGIIKKQAQELKSKKGY